MYTTTVRLSHTPSCTSSKRNLHVISVPHLFVSHIGWIVNEIYSKNGGAVLPPPHLLTFIFHAWTNVCVCLGVFVFCWILRISLNMFACC